MSKYQKQLLKYIKENKSFIIPASKRNEILNRLKTPLQDLSISRETVKWGIPFFVDKKFTLFVWIDALLNYLTAINYPGDKFKKFWPAEIQTIGKDIIWHHSVIWGSLLLSLGLPLPKTILVHGFITVAGQKMSKSLGNVIDPFELVKKYGTDAVRYFLLREIPPTEDGDFTYQKFEGRYNADLANGLGNLVARVITLANKLKVKSEKLKVTVKNSKLNKIIDKTWKDYRKVSGEFKFNEALIEIWHLVSFCDGYIERERPWEESKSASWRKKEVIGNLLFAIRNIAEMLQPFLPETSEKIFKNIRQLAEKTKETKPLFPRI